MRRKSLLVFLIIIFYFAFFFFRNAMTLDPDFGWHLQYGRLVIRTHSIPIDDTYSYTMPSYHFINHEWGSDIIIANLYDVFGMWPLTLFYALLGTGVLYILSKNVDVRWAGTLFFLIGGTMFALIGVRPQVISWTLTALLVSLLWQKEVWYRWRFYVPLLFLFWANVHGGFAIGIVILGWFVFSETLQHRKIDKKDASIFILSFIATLCNPYGYHLWIEVARTVTDSGLHWEIQEWYPVVYFTDIAFWIYLAISLFLVIRYWKKFSVTILGIYIFLFVAGLSSVRNVPLFVIVSFYPTLQGCNYLYEEAGKYLYGKERFLRGYIFFSIVAMCFYLPQLGVFTYSVIKYGGSQNSYPAGAVAYLKTHLPKGNIFSSYGWGGYLIWQLPEKKVFIDGRMPSWHNPGAPSNESTYAFGDYMNILENKKSFALISKKYDIDTLLISPSDLNEQHLFIFGSDVQNNPLFKNFLIPNLTFVPVAAQIKAMGWKKVYQDKEAIVFEKQ